MGIEPTVSRPPVDGTAGNFTVYILLDMDNFDICSFIIARILLKESTQKLSMLHTCVSCEHDELVFLYTCTDRGSELHLRNKTAF